MKLDRDFLESAPLYRKRDIDLSDGQNIVIFTPIKMHCPVCGTDQTCTPADSFVTHPQGSIGEYRFT